MQTTNLQQLKIRKMTKAQYDTITPSTGELDFVIDAGLPDGTTVAFNSDMNFEAVGTKNANTSTTFYAWRQLFDQVTIVYTTVPYTEGLEELKVYNSNFQEIVPDDPTENYFYNNQLWYQNEEGTSFYCSRLAENDKVFNPVKQWIGTREQYDAITTKDNGTYYTLVDEGKVYLGTLPVGGGTSTMYDSTSETLTFGS